MGSSNLASSFFSAVSITVWCVYNSFIISEMGEFPLTLCRCWRGLFLVKSVKVGDLLIILLASLLRGGKKCLPLHSNWRL